MDHHNVIGVEISGQLWAQPVPLELLVRTEIDLETGQVEVADLEAVVSCDLCGAGEEGRHIGSHRSTVLQRRRPRTAFAQIAGSRRTMSVMQQRIDRLRLGDGTSVSYAMAGSGPPLVYLPGWVSHVELGWALPPERRFYESLASGRTLVRYDRPGCGLSDPAPTDDLIGVEMEVLDALFHALNVQRADLLGTAAFVATAEDLVIAKLEWAATSGSDRQIRDIEAILAIDDKLDVDYIDRWAATLGLADLWASLKSDPNVVDE